MVKAKMYQKIQELKKKGYGKLAISRSVGIDPATVRKYYDMSPEKYRNYLTETSMKEKVFDGFEDEILSIYKSNGYRKLNMSAVYDYLEEKFEKLTAKEKTLRNYIHFLEKTGKLKYQNRARIYTNVEELPYGEQMQLDFGEYRLKSSLKLYIFAIVLSSSRYKYITFQDMPFKTIDIILHLLDAFDYFEGCAKELVIDQDSLMVTRENYGEIIYTKQFSSFIEKMGIKMRVCRKANPESKDKIENIIKYVKYNFLSVRDFENVIQANESVRNWLERKANGKISQVNKKIPSIEIEKERGYIKPPKNSIYRKTSCLGRKERTVSDKSVIMVEGKEYSVPLEYRAKKVEFYKTDSKVFIFDKETGKEITSHRIPKVGIKKVYKRNHFRCNSLSLKELENKVLLLFDNGKWRDFTERTKKAFPRYRRDQYTLSIEKFTKIEKPEIFTEALNYCLENKTYGMKKLFDTYMYLINKHKTHQNTPLSFSVKKSLLPNRASSIEVSKRTIDTYEAFIASNNKEALL